MALTSNVSDKMRKTDVVLTLRPVGGKALSSTGLLDTKLFKGDNRLHMVQDPQTCLWTLHYDKGVVPPIFKQQWTSRNKCLEFVNQYMVKRNVEIVEVLD